MVSPQRDLQLIVNSKTHREANFHRQKNTPPTPRHSQQEDGKSPLLKKGDWRNCLTKLKIPTRSKELLGHSWNFPKFTETPVPLEGSQSNRKIDVWSLLKTPHIINLLKLKSEALGEMRKKRAYHYTTLTNRNAGKIPKRIYEMSHSAVILNKANIGPIQN